MAYFLSFRVIPWKRSNLLQVRFADQSRFAQFSCYSFIGISEMLDREPNQRWCIHVSMTIHVLPRRELYAQSGPMSGLGWPKITFLRKG